jgi:predicted amino acid dehydrogenase
MVIQESLSSRLVNGVENRGINRGAVFSILEKYREKIPPNVWATSLDKIDRAFEEFKASREQLKGQATSAFFVHTRRDMNGSSNIDNSFELLDDSAKYLPILAFKYGIPDRDVEKLLNSLPPLKIGEIKGIIGNKKINCAIISVPITPKSLDNCSRQSEKLNYARPRISQAAELADRMGANIIGLGETLASLTHHGTVLQKEFPDKSITTGHAFTTYFMKEWTKFVAEKAGLDLKKSPITIIGANGSIGFAITQMLLLEGASKLRLHDKEDAIGAMHAKSEEIHKMFPDVEIKITGGDDNLKEACKGSRIVLVAASAPKPFIKAEHLDRGTFVINDSQPPSITREEAQKAGSTTLWVAGSLPGGVTNTFDNGLVNGEWTCALEVLALEALDEKPFDTVDRVTPQRVIEAGKVARKLGIALAPPQSWGVIEAGLQ